MSNANRKVYDFKGFRLDGAERRLLHNGRPVQLKSKIFDLLLLLVEKRGQLVEKDELMREIWPNTIVEENNITVSMSILRKRLGEDRAGREFIETIPRRGYRFVASVSDDRDVCPTIPRARLAVLPATHTGSDHHFAEGFTEELRAELGRISAGAVAVIARSSSILVGAEPRRASEIGEALRADYVLEGSVRSDGDRLRITVCLVETIGETHVWSETVECRSTRPLNTQVEVAARLAQSVTQALRQKDSSVVRF